MGRYDDIIHLPHHVSPTRAKMSRADRAAQFAPFAALTGHDAAVRETARLTEGRAELDEDQKAVLNRKLQFLLTIPDAQPEVTVTWFRPDAKKSGGAYVTVTGFVRKIDAFAQTLRLFDAEAIPIEQIFAIEGEIFPDDAWFRQI